MSFGDHFSTQSESYARHRPTYPDAVIDLVASLAAAHRAAWDCATGNGQAALALAERFEMVFATDGSERQLANAKAHPRVVYRHGTAEASGLEDGSVDAVAVAQAAHWFDLPRFVAECRRVGRPGAPVVMWGYLHATVSPEIDAVLVPFKDRVSSFWPPGRDELDAGYHRLVWDLEDVDVSDLSMTARWNADDYLGYLATWSSVARYRDATGDDPLGASVAPLREAWGSGARVVTWPLTIRAGRI